MSVKRIKKTVLCGLVTVCLVAGTKTVYAENSATESTGSWRYEQSVWRHYDVTGGMVTGWIKTSSGWFYLDPKDGAMKTGWLLTEDGSWSFLNTEVGDGFGKMVTGWQWIDGHCYFFEPLEGNEVGKLYVGKITPDGFQTNSKGQWVDPDGSVHYQEGKGITTNKESKKSGIVRSGGSLGGSSSGSSGSSNQGNNPGGGDTDTSNENHQDFDILLKEKETKLVNLGWIQYAVISFQEGTLDDYTVFVDGTDITAGCSRVDDDGRIVKWQTTVVSPKIIRAVRNTDQSEQSVRISKGSKTSAPEIGNLNSAPYYILTNGPISRFDYYLDVYDKDGNVRREPERTTFSLGSPNEQGKKEVPNRYYLPDVMMDLKSGKGEILVKLSLETEEQEAWFRQIKTIKTLNMDNNIINGNLPFSSEIDTAYGKTGVINIPLPQDNMRARGRYQINLTSAYSNNKLTLPLHLVDNRKFTMQLNGMNTNPKPGEDFAFDIVGPDGDTFGTDLVIPIYQVDLTMPSGEITTLVNMDNWYEIGPFLKILGTNEEGDILTKESGVYTVTVYAHGYQTMSKKVEVWGTGLNKNLHTLAVSADTSLKVMGLDAIASATITPGDGSEGGDSGGGIDGKVNGYLLFDHDLLSNALILEEIGSDNPEAKAVADRWYSQSPESVMWEDAEVLYKFTHYLNAFKDARLEQGQYLTFEDYAINRQDGITQDRAGEVKRVLEDGLLGTVFSFSDVVGKEVPELLGTEVTLGENFTLTCLDPLYISKIKEMYLDGSGTPLRSDSYLREYQISPEKDELTVYHSAMNPFHMPLVGNHTLVIHADGYQSARVTLTVKKALEEFDLSLYQNPEAKEGDVADTYYVGQDVYIKAAGDEDDSVSGDFIKNIGRISLTDPDGNTKTILSQSQGMGSNEAYYLTKDNTIILKKGVFKTEGEYIVIVSSESYAPKTLRFNMEPEGQIPTQPEDEKKTPEFKTAVLKEQFFYPKYYEISFTGLEPKDIGKYLDTKEKVITVNGVEYEGKGSISMGSEFAYCVSNDSSYGGPNIYMLMTSDGFTEDSNQVTIEVEGYETIEFTVVNKQGSSGQAKKGTLTDEMLPPVSMEDIPGESVQEEPAEEEPEQEEPVVDEPSVPIEDNLTEPVVETKEPSENSEQDIPNPQEISQEEDAVITVSLLI